MADLTQSKSDAIASAQSARRALRGLREQLKEQTATVVDSAISVAGAAGAGYARASYGADYQLLGYDASLVTGLAAMGIGLYMGGANGTRLIAASVGALCEYAAMEGGKYYADSQQAEPAAQGVRGAAADYLRAYAGQHPSAL